MQQNDLLVYEPGNQYPDPKEIAPYATLPTWWRSFIFSILNGRELQVYIYIVMEADAKHAIAYPSIEAMREAMELKSDVQVYDALNGLEALGFIRRRKSRLPNQKSQALRNIYQRTAPEFLLLTLIKRSHPSFGGVAGEKAIDEYLAPGICPIPFRDSAEQISISDNITLGFTNMLGKQGLLHFLSTPPHERRAVLVELLDAKLEARKLAAQERYAGLKLKPKGRRRLRTLGNPPVSE